MYKPSNVTKDNSATHRLTQCTMTPNTNGLKIVRHVVDNLNTHVPHSATRRSQQMIDCPTVTIVASEMGQKGQRPEGSCMTRESTLKLC